MSDAHAHDAIRSEATATLRRYDETRQAAMLQQAGDQISRDDGTAPPDPALARRIGQDRVVLWAELLARFKRDLDPDFDPDNAPTMQIMPPLVGNMQLPPGVPPSAITDPALRHKYEQDIAANKTRIARYAEQNRLHEAHVAMLERAEDSVRDAHDKLGLSAEEIRAALAKGDILPNDREALLKAALP